MYERFTRDARRVLVMAQEEVRELGSEVAGTEHLLLALTRVDELVGDLLYGLGATHERLRQELRPGPGAGQVVPLGADFKAVLEWAVKHADHVGQTEVGPKELLLGLLEIGGASVVCMEAAGVLVEDVRQAVRAVVAFDAEPSADDLTRLFPVAPPIPELEGDVLGRESAEPRCPACHKVATNAVRHLRVPVDIEVTVDLVYCGWCGHLLTTRIVERG